jgi:predicted DNA-binding WGR domain protein
MEKIRYHDIYKTCFIKFLFWGFEGAAARQPPPSLGCPPERTYWIHNVSRASEVEEFHIQFGRLKNEGQKCFKYFRISIQKSENLKQLLPTDKRRTHDGDVA